MRGSVGRRREPERPPEARRERADAAEADGEADVGGRPVGVPQERRRALEAAVARFEALGGWVKERKQETIGPFTHDLVVMADPEGNGFCVQEAR